MIAFHNWDADALTSWFQKLYLRKYFPSLASILYQSLTEFEDGNIVEIIGLSKT